MCILPLLVAAEAVVSVCGPGVVSVAWGHAVAKGGHTGPLSLSA